MRSKQSYTFEHEGVQTAPTKIPKFEVKYSRKQTPKGISAQTQTGEGYISGEAPANVYTVSTYSPLTQQIDLPAADGLPSLISPGSSFQTASPGSSNQTASTVGSASSLTPAQVSPVPQEIQNILDQTQAYENFLNQISNTQTWNGEGIPVFRRPNAPPPIQTQNLSPRTRPSPGFYYESPGSSSDSPSPIYFPFTLSPETMSPSPLPYYRPFSLTPGTAGPPSYRTTPGTAGPPSYRTTPGTATPTPRARPPPGFYYESPGSGSS